MIMLADPSLTRTQQRARQRDVDEAVRRRLAECPYAFVFNKVHWECREGCLTLRGQVSSFHLKQLLQEFVRYIPRVDRIVNDVDVVSATGLSSVRARARVPSGDRHGAPRSAPRRERRV